MNRTLVGLPPKARTGLGVVELKLDEYDMDDLAGEIARALAACHDLTEESQSTGNDGGEIAQAR